jgi:beta-phosphoglucomutase-like phosphatase (HAD superfamily)
MSDRRFDLVIFDCDGVLVDREPIINRTHAQALTACGYPITEELLRHGETEWNAQNRAVAFYLAFANDLAVGRGGNTSDRPIILA